MLTHTGDPRSVPRPSLAGITLDRMPDGRCLSSISLAAAPTINVPTEVGASHLVFGPGLAAVVLAGGIGRGGPGFDHLGPDV